MNSFFPDAIPFSFPGLPKVHCLFGTRHGGDMSLSGNAPDRARAAGNRLRLQQLAGFRRWAEVYQVHGDLLVPAVAITPGEGGAERADGHYTADKETGLVIKTADCQPIFLVRRDGAVAAGLHVGWRGNAAKFPTTAVERLCALFACDPSDLYAVRGPSLGPAASEFVNFASEWPAEFQPWFNETDRTVNLWKLTQHQLRQAGMPAENIFSLDLCTHTMANWFFSYRKGDSGRQVSVLWLE